MGQAELPRVSLRPPLREALTPTSRAVLQKLQGPAAASEAGAGRLHRRLRAQGRPAQEARAALLPGGHRSAGAGTAEPGAGRGVAEGTGRCMLPPPSPFLSSPARPSEGRAPVPGRAGLARGVGGAGGARGSVPCTQLGLYGEMDRGPPQETDLRLEAWVPPSYLNPLPCLLQFYSPAHTSPGMRAEYPRRKLILSSDKLILFFPFKKGEILPCHR